MNVDVSISMDNHWAFVCIVGGGFILAAIP